jgi:hypothetical protein
MKLKDLKPEGWSVGQASASDGENKPIPDGWYTMHVETTDLVKTKAGNGWRMGLGLVVDGPKFAGRWVFANLNVANPNSQAQEIAWQDMDRLCQALDLSDLPDDHTGFRGKVLDVKVKTEQQDGYDPRNEPKAFAKKGSKTNGAPPAAAEHSFDKSFDDDDLPF